MKQAETYWSFVKKQSKFVSRRLWLQKCHSCTCRGSRRHLLGGGSNTWKKEKIVSSTIRNSRPFCFFALGFFRTGAAAAGLFSEGEGVSASALHFALALGADWLFALAFGEPFALAFTPAFAFAVGAAACHRIYFMSEFISCQIRHNVPTI